MSKAKLTTSQKEIIKKLENEFLRLNAEEPKSGGLIDVQGIKARVTQEQNFEREIRAENKAFFDLKRNQMIKDAESLKDDLDELGLHVIIGSTNGAHFYIAPKKANLETVSKTAYVFVNYTNTHHIERRCNDLKRDVDCQYGIKFNNDSYGGSHKTFADALNSHDFKNKIRYVYERTLRD